MFHGLAILHLLTFVVPQVKILSTLSPESADPWTTRARFLNFQGSRNRGYELIIIAPKLDSLVERDESKSTTLKTVRLPTAARLV